MKRSRKRLALWSEALHSTNNSIVFIITSMQQKHAVMEIEANGSFDVTMLANAIRSICIVLLLMVSAATAYPFSEENDCMHYAVVYVRRDQSKQLEIHTAHQSTQRATYESLTCCIISRCQFLTALS